MKLLTESKINNFVNAKLFCLNGRSDLIYYHRACWKVSSSSIKRHQNDFYKFQLSLDGNLFYSFSELFHYECNYPGMISWSVMAVTEVNVKLTLWMRLNKIFILMTKFVNVTGNFVILNGADTLETTAPTCCTFSETSWRNFVEDSL